MAGVQDQRLALAVARTGAVGSLPCAMLTPDAMRSQLQALHTGCAAQHTYNVNFFCHTPQASSRACSGSLSRRKASGLTLADQLRV